MKYPPRAYLPSQTIKFLNENKHLKVNQPDMTMMLMTVSLVNHNHSEGEVLDQTLKAQSAHHGINGFLKTLLTAVQPRSGKTLDTAKRKGPRATLDLLVSRKNTD